MAKQVVYNEQKLLVSRDENGRLCFYTKDSNPAKYLDKTDFGYLFFVDDPYFLPFIKTGEKPSLCLFRAVNVYNFNIRVNVERGIATRDRYGVLVFKPVSSTKQDNLLIFDSKFLPVVTEGSLYNIEIKKLR